MMRKLFFFFLIFSSFLLAQISPGELTTAHSDLDGLSHCTKCHELGQKVINSKCLDCHKEISTLITLNSGYHSSSDVKGKNCSKCHPEHFGRNFKIINFDPKSFDHSKTSYDLTGAHKKTDCNKCHQAKNISDPELKKKETYLGLNSFCFSCHEDYHQKTLGDDCGKCHNSEKFKPAAHFDHNKANFKLTGKHLNVKCIRCHPVNKKSGKDFQKFTGLKFNNCTPCHKDKHEGKFGNVCNNCHVTTGFTIINKKRFDHSKTNYPLLGKHQEVNCEKCHQKGLNDKPQFKKCINCHKDYHKGQFVQDNILRDCTDCHNVYGFRPAIFTINKHNSGKFKLTGAHLATPCEKCHYDKENWNFRNLGLNCIDCHKNIHGNEIIEKYLGNNECTGCHNTESWSTINFDHKRTEFELLGKHKNQKCGSCHHKESGLLDDVMLFKSLGKNCEVCHKDMHAGQFKEGDSSNCTRCHSFDNWKPDKFDHEKTRFSLKGAHEKIKCNKCHPIVAANFNYIKYKMEDFKCSACHS